MDKKQLWRDISLILLCLLLAFVLAKHLLKEKKELNRIVLITIDSLRADHLSSYGYPRKTSPFIDELATKGILFKNAFTSSAASAPSYSSIFTSLYPIQHNLLSNGETLDDKYFTLAEVLKQNGFRTAGLIATNDIGKNANIPQGFNLVSEKNIKTKARKASETVDAIINGAEKLGTKAKTGKFFLWIHFSDLHESYPLPKSYLKVFAKQSNDSFIKFLLDKHKINLSSYGNDTKKMFHAINSYDRKILFVDKQIKRLYSYFLEEGLNENTLWIITSDHGEGLGNHGWLYHDKHIYNEQLHVPLVFHSPSNLLGKKVVGHLVETIDILPTILDFLEIDIKETKQSQNIQGISLFPFILGKNTYEKEYAFAQSKGGEKSSIQTKDYKYINDIITGKEEFYNLSEDPFELNNITDINVEEEKILRELLTKKLIELQN